VSQENVEIVLAALARLRESYESGAATDGLLDLCAPDIRRDRKRPERRAQADAHHERVMASRLHARCSSACMVTILWTDIAGDLVKNHLGRRRSRQRAPLVGCVPGCALTDQRPPRGIPSPRSGGVS
jgi:hypothetical protein